MSTETFDLTIGITSFNRLLYLTSLFKSLESFDREKIQFVVVDTGSTEKGLIDFLKQQYENKKIHHLFLIKSEERSWTNDEYKAKNIIIDESKSDVILFLQDDLECLVSQDVLLNAAKAFLGTWIRCCEVNAVRKSTISSNHEAHPAIFRQGIRFWVPKNNHFHTMGFFRKDLFEKFGKYPTSWPETQEYWGKSEDWFDDLLKRAFPGQNLNVSLWVPLFAPVWNDPRGGYAFIRGDKRYGHYLPPQNNENFYKKIDDNEHKNLQLEYVPLSFVDVCKPEGWSYKIDSNGDQIKYPQSKVMLEGPIKSI